MRQETIEILKKHGCLYMASDYRDLIEEIEEYYTSEQKVKNLSLSAVSVNEVAVCSARKSYQSCDLHHDNKHGCEECGNYE